MDKNGLSIDKMEDVSIIKIYSHNRLFKIIRRKIELIQVSCNTMSLFFLRIKPAK